MVGSIEDSEVRALAGISQALEAEYVSPSEDPWAGSPFAWILRRPSRQKGAIGERLVAAWCTANGMDVVRSPSSEADRIINGHKIEVKFSTLWASGGYKFQQVRDQAYDHLLCIGISPFAAHAWILPKTVLFEHVIGHTGQHTGAGGTDTAWIGFQAGKPYQWMEPYGGTLADALRVFQALGRGSH